MGDTKRLFLIDGAALAYRSYFAFIRNPLVTTKGLNTSAIYGFTTAVLRLIEEEQPEYLVIVNDSPTPTFRHEMYAEYKATRERMPDEMSTQLPRLDDVIEALHIPTVAAPGYEADDIMATFAKRCEELDIECWLVSGDKDLAQMVSNRVRMYDNVRKGGQVHRVGIEEVKKKFGVPPEQIVDFLSLVGDTSDNIPGVKGVGEKTAAKLLSEYGSLEAVLANAEKVAAKRVREGLIASREDALRSKQLVILDTEAPVEFDLETFRLREPDHRRLLELFEEFEFHSLMDRVRGDESTDEHRYHRIADEQEFEALLEQLTDAKEFVFDLETTSLSPLEAQIVGLSFAVKEQEACYVPTFPERPILAGGGLLDSSASQLDLILDRLRPLFEDEKIKKGAHNAKYDMLVLRNYRIEVRGLRFDTMVASYLIDPSLRQHNLDFLSLRHLNYKKIPTSDLIGSGKDQISMKDVPIGEVAMYSCEDADMTMRLHRQFQPRLRKLKLDKLYDDVEIPLVAALMRMEEHGIRVDPSLLGQMSEEIGQRIESLAGQIYELAGEEFNINSPKQLSPILYDKLQIHKKLGVRVKRTKTGFSTDMTVLEMMAEHPLVRALLDYRSLSKLKGTYVDALPSLISERTGKIHTSFNQTVTATGRLSSSNPNLQNIPIRTELGRRVRAAFVPEDEARVLLSADYSQIELRVMAHLSGDEALTASFVQDEDVHARTAALIFGVDIQDVAPEMRGRAKTINFGVMYGMGPIRLARETGTTLAEAEAFIRAYFEKYPGVRRYTEEQVQKARDEGYVSTMLGRRRTISDIRSQNQRTRSNAERTAVNTPIQGSAADLIKVAMVNIDRRLAQEGRNAKMLLQVHDELVFEVPKAELDAVTALVRHEMEHALELRVPIKVDVGVGENWLEAH